MHTRVISGHCVYFIHQRMNNALGTHPHFVAEQRHLTTRRAFQQWPARLPGISILIFTASVLHHIVAISLPFHRSYLTMMRLLLLPYGSCLPALCSSLPLTFPRGQGLCLINFLFFSTPNMVYYTGERLNTFNFNFLTFWLASAENFFLACLLAFFLFFFFFWILCFQLG